MQVAIRPANTAIPATASLSGHPVEEIAIAIADGITVRGWLVRAATDSRRCVVLAAGVHGNRLAMRERATWYLQHGWSTLLVDLRGTGASDAAPITMGWLEARDLRAVRAWAATQDFDTIAAHGCSLGAAAIVYAGDGPWEFGPTLLLCGDSDVRVGEDATAALLAHSPAARKLAVAIAGAGHENLWSRAPDVCARALAQFVP